MDEEQEQMNIMPTGENADLWSLVSGLNQVLQDNPDDLNALYNRGTALSLLGRHQEALRDYDHYLERCPDDHETLYNRGIANNNLKKHEEALSDFNESLRLNPDDPDTLNNRGISLRELGRYEEALQDYTRSLELKPDDPSTLSNKGTTLFHLDRLQEAMDTYNRSLQIRPDDPDTLYNRSELLFKLSLSDDVEKKQDVAPGTPPPPNTPPAVQQTGTGAMPQRPSEDASRDSKIEVTTIRHDWWDWWLGNAAPWPRKVLAFVLIISLAILIVVPVVYLLVSLIAGPGISNIGLDWQYYLIAVAAIIVILLIPPFRRPPSDRHGEKKKS